jgi:hypothetical protein
MLPSLSVFAFVLLAVPLAQHVVTEATEAEVYRVALGAITFEDLGSRSKRHALVSSTFDPGAFWRGLDAETRKSTPDLDPRQRITYARTETVEAFLEVIGTEKDLPAALGSMPEFLLVQRKEIRALAERDQLPDFERRNALAPGTVAVSRIGFDASGSQALLYVSFSCGSLCGSDYFVLVEHGSLGWHVVKVDGYSVS